MDSNQNTSEEENPEILTNDVKTQAAVSYFLLFAPILYVNRNDSPFIQFHALQATVLLAAFIIIWLLGDLFFLIHYLNFAVVGACVVGFIQAQNGKMYKIPLVSTVVAEGISPRKIWKGLVKAIKISGKILLGFFPKKTGARIAKQLKIDPDAHMIERMENLEKIFLLDKFFHPETSLSLSKLFPEISGKNEFSAIFKELKQADSSCVLHDEGTFYEISGDFGTLILGGVHAKKPEEFSYAVILKTPKKMRFETQNGFEFGGFTVGKKLFGENFLEILSISKEKKNEEKK